MPLPAWNCFIPKDGNSQSAKNKWNSWHQMQKKPLINIQESLVHCYSFESNSGFKHRLALTLSHTQLVFSIKGTVLRSFIIRVFWTSDQEESTCANRFSIPRGVSEERGVSLPGLNP